MAGTPPSVADHERPGAPPLAGSTVTLVAGGDVSFGRDTGQRMLEDPNFEPLQRLAPLLASADMTFVNLESPLADNDGQTRHPDQPLTFCGPPRSASSLTKAGIDVVSLANNHAWDYGKAGLLETLQHLGAAGVSVVGAAAEPNGAAEEAITFSVRGWSVAWLAATEVWNAGEAAREQARGHVAFADVDRISRAVASAHGEHDLVLVSYHGGREYSPHVAPAARAFARAALAAGADAVLGHHPHVTQGVEWRAGRPAIYSLANLRFETHGEHVWTARGFLVRLRFFRDHRPELSLCPYQIDRDGPVLVMGALAERFRRHFIQVTSYAGFSDVGVLDAQGCFAVTERRRDDEPHKD